MLRKDSQSYVCLKNRPPGLWSQVEKSKNFCMEFLSDNVRACLKNALESTLDLTISFTGDYHSRISTDWCATAY